MNGDGKPDLLVANNTDGTVSALLNATASGSSAASFAAQQTFAVGSGPSAVAVGDVNGDGKPDLLVANFNDYTVSVLRNVTAPGATTAVFVAQQTFATGSDPEAIALGDFNGDGLPDLATANYGDNNVSVLLNQTVLGAGNITPAFPATAFAVGRKPTDVSVADVNGDGKPDVVSANYNDGTVGVLLNTTAPGAATPTFAAQQTFATGRHPIFLAVVDLNGDGLPDLAVANELDGTMSVLLNTTAPGATVPTFAAQQSFAVGGFLITMTAADVNGDGKPDLVVDNSGSGGVSVLLNTTAPANTTASFATAAAFSTGGRNAETVVAADINGDGRPDILLTSISSFTLSVLLNTTAPGATTPTFATVQTFAEGNGPYGLAVADVNGDGKPDVVLTNYGDNAAAVLLNTTASGATAVTFATASPFSTGAGPKRIALADVNGDGRPDILVANYIAGTVSVLLNATAPGANAAAFATQPAFVSGPLPYTVAVADVNGDGRPDLVTESYGNNTVVVLLNTPATIPGDFAAGTIIEVSSVVQFASANETLGENAGNFTLAVTLSAASGTATTVPYTLGGTAVAGIDYAGLTAGNVVIPAGCTTVAIAGAVVDEGLYGGPAYKSLTVTLGTPGNATLGANATNTLTISPVTPRPAISGLTPQERYVQAVYLDELGRAGGKGDLDYWVGVLNSPKGGAAAMVAGIKGSPEGTARLVRTWYELYLGRPAVNGEEGFWAGKLQHGETEESVISQILNTSEFYARSRTFGFSGTDNEKLVRAYYRVLLHRTASDAEVASQLKVLRDGGGTAVASGMLGSPEFRTGLFEAYYDGLLHRASKAGEVAGWVSTSLDASAVRGKFEASAEFMGNG